MNNCSEFLRQDTYLYFLKIKTIASSKKLKLTSGTGRYRFWLIFWFEQVGFS